MAKESKFTELKKLVENNQTSAELNFIIEKHNTLPSEDRDKAIAEKFGVSQRTSRKWIEELGLSEPKVINKSPFIKDAEQRILKDSKYYLITCAQNATPIHQNFFDNLKEYADFLGAEIHIIPIRYKNPTSVWTDKQASDDWWATDTIPYLDLKRHSLHKNLQLLSDIKIQPTASLPLNGLEGFTAYQSCIVGHPKMQLKSCPVLAGEHRKVMLTTGSCTIENYINSKAGKRGEFHHVIGFVIVEIKDNDVFYIRQVMADDNGDFIDYCHSVKDGNVSKINQIEGIRVGDIHVANRCNEKLETTVHLIEKLNPKKVVIDDIYDGERVNHHIKDDFVTRFKMLQSNRYIIQEEIDEMIEWLDWFKGYTDKVGAELVITKANHDNFLDRFINRADWRKDLHNAQTIIELQRIALSQECDNGIIPYLINQKYPDIKCLRYNESYKIGEVENSQHGDIGANGARGGINQFKNYSTKMCTAHCHSIFRIDGVVTVGTSTKLDMDYVKGASSWGWCDVIFHENGKNQQLIYMNNYKVSTFEL